ncbi:hypothetical protein BGZ65_005069, partial [Modicella reniformis]
KVLSPSDPDSDKEVLHRESPKRKQCPTIVNLLEVLENLTYRYEKGDRSPMPGTPEDADFNEGASCDQPDVSETIKDDFDDVELSGNPVDGIQVMERIVKRHGPMYEQTFRLVREVS